MYGISQILGQVSVKVSLMVFLASLALTSLASTELVMSTTKSAAGEKAQEIIVSIQDKKLRVDDTDVDTSKKTPQLVYNGQTETLLMIDHEQRSYAVIDKAAMMEIKSKMDAAMQQMEAQLAQMPPEQRQMMEKMMKGRMPMPTRQEPKDVRKTGRTASAAGYECSISEVYSEGSKVKELCVTPWAEIKNSDQISMTFQGMMDLFTRMFESLSQSVPVSMELPFSEMVELGGFPVMVTEFDSNGATETTRLVSITDKTFPVGFFSAPGSYKKQEMFER